MNSIGKDIFRSIHEGKRVYDPCCGSGGMFVQSVKFIQEHAGNRSNI